MRVYKRSYPDGTESENWQVEFRDPRFAGRKLIRVSAFSEREASSELARKMKAIADCQAANQPLSAALRRWLETVPDRILKLLDQNKLTAPEISANMKNLEIHLDDYRQAMEAKNCAPAHVKWTVSQISKIIKGCEFKRWSDVDAHVVKIFLTKLRTGGREIKTRSYNGYVTALHSFANWAVENGRLPYSPLATLHKLKITDETQRRHLSLDELRILLEVTERAADRFGMTGPDRAMLYVGCETGLRAGELRSLTRASFDLAADSPAVTIVAAKAKNRKNARIDLSPSLAASLRTYLEHKLPGAAAFAGMPESTHTAEMFRADLAEARTAWIADAPDPKEREARETSDTLKDVDDAGRVAVFHSTRHTRGVILAQHLGASSRETKELLRVSSEALVARYTAGMKIAGNDFAARMPDLSSDPVLGKNRAQATGTSGPNQDQIARRVARSSMHVKGVNLQHDAGSEERGRTDVNPVPTRGSDVTSATERLMGAVGFEPTKAYAIRFTV